MNLEFNLIWVILSTVGGGLIKTIFDRWKGKANSSSATAQDIRAELRVDRSDMKQQRDAVREELRAERLERYEVVRDRNKLILENGRLLRELRALRADDKEA